VIWIILAGLADEPPTHMLALRSAQGESADWTYSDENKEVVARDGIEPPTPAFSGPRSTTELPGLSEDFQLQFLRGIRRCRKKGWAGPRSVRCND
jgi:hypothetical protein